jgi:hypothetical protein
MSLIAALQQAALDVLEIGAHPYVLIRSSIIQVNPSPHSSSVTSVFLTHPSPVAPLAGQYGSFSLKYLLPESSSQQLLLSLPTDC